MKDKVQKILDEAYRLICNRLGEEKINYDSNTDCTVFWDDTDNKHTYCISLNMDECPEYYDYYDGE